MAWRFREALRSQFAPSFPPKRAVPRARSVLMGRTRDGNPPCAPALERGMAGTSQEPSQQGKRCPLSPQAASLLPEVGGASALWKRAFWQPPRPPSTPLSKGSMQKGAIWSFVDTFSPVQYLPGVNARAWLPSVSCPSPPPTMPHLPSPVQDIAGCGGQAY